MSPEQRRYIFIQSCVGAAIVNALLNAGFGWLVTRQAPDFPVWAAPGVVPDIIGTAFGVTFGTWLAVSFQVKRDLSKNRITVPDMPEAFALFASRLPRGLFKQSVWLGILAVPIFCPPVLVALFVSGVAALDRNSFILLKSGFSAVEGAIVTPLIVLLLLAQNAPQKASPAH